MPEREVDNQSPSEINSYHISNNVLSMDVLELRKKRKFQTEQFGLLPLPKHVCLDHGTSPHKPNGPYDSNNNNNNSDRSCETVSVEDSNSFMAVDSVYSASSVNPGSFSFKGNNEFVSMECTDEITDESSGSSIGDRMFRNHLQFVCSEYGAGNLEEYAEKDVEGILYPDNDDMKQHNATYVLSSGRWTVNQDSSQQGTRKPTIDQEFEQYFSMLML